ACAHRGLRLWADALVPALAVPPSPADVSLIDDPATAAAWTNALAEAAANRFDPFLAAPWDPRLEQLLQHRLRDWARAFNPGMGVRRCEDSAWTLVGFSSGWRNAFLFTVAATNAPVPPAFFRDGFLEEWNGWLYDRYDGSDETAAAGGVLLPGESVASNAVAWVGSPFGPPPDPATPAARIRDEKLFLQELYLAHVRRLVRYFRDAGGRMADVPVYVKWGEGTKSLLAAASDIRFADAAEYGFPTVAFFPADGGPAALEAALDAGCSALVFPCGGDPVPFAPWARAFRAGANAERFAPDVVAATDGQSAAMAGAWTFWSGMAAGETVAPTGVGWQFLDAGPDDRPDGPRFSPADGRRLSVAVWLPAGEATDRIRVECAFAPDGPGAPASLFARVRDAETGADVPFGLVAAGPFLRKREWCDLSPGADPGKHGIPKDRVFRLPAAAGPRLLLIRPETVESDILKRLEAEGVGF
ncbi:MAG: hypothetical protein II839_12310, partial [Kiritimatiellae bacterium]|nr:hypothetical protein [Kiritimatiellia bacterium]